MRTNYPDYVIKTLKEECKYDPDKGTITRKVYGVYREIGWYRNGYVICDIKDHKIGRSRIAWFLTHGYWPDMVIDHINGNRDDDRITNLRHISYSMNGLNSHGKLGYKVCKNGFEVSSKVNNVRHYIGSFKNPQDAQKAYMDFVTKTYPGEKFQPLKKIPEAHLTLGNELVRNDTAKRRKPLSDEKEIVKMFDRSKYVNTIMKFLTDGRNEVIEKFHADVKARGGNIHKKKGSGVRICANTSGMFAACRDFAGRTYYFGFFNTPEEAQALYIHVMMKANLFDERLLVPISAEQYNRTDAEERSDANSYFEITTDEANFIKKSLERPAMKSVANKAKKQRKNKNDKNTFSVSENGKVLFTGTLAEVNSFIFNMNEKKNAA